MGVILDVLPLPEILVGGAEEDVDVLIHLALAAIAKVFFSFVIGFIFVIHFRFISFRTISEEGS